MDKIFTNLVKGCTDKKLKDTVYQDNIDGIERTFIYDVKPLSKNTMIDIPVYSNMFHSLIDNEANGRFKDNFYKD